MNDELIFRFSLHFYAFLGIWYIRLVVNKILTTKLDIMSLISTKDKLLHYNKYHSLRVCVWLSRIKKNMYINQLSDYCTKSPGLFDIKKLYVRC